MKRFQSLFSFEVLMALLLLGGSRALAQTPTQNIKGTVTDSDTQLPLPVAMMSILDQERSLSALRFLALGDSYTIGQGVSEADSWPWQLTKTLNQNGITTSDPTVIAKTGWTTQNLIDALRRESPEPPYNLVSLLIGVNNQFQNRSIAEYKLQFRELLELSIRYAGGDTSHVFVVSIPDYGNTPFGSQNQKDISSEIDQFNAACREIAETYQIPFFDITPISRQYPNQPNWVAGDGLHPSGKQYAAWVERIYSELLARGTLD